MNQEDGLLLNNMLIQSNITYTYIGMFFFSNIYMNFRVIQLK